MCKGHLLDWKLAVLTLIILIGPPCWVQAVPVPAGSIGVHVDPPFPFNFWTGPGGNFTFEPDEEGEHHAILVSEAEWARSTPIAGSFNTKLWGLVVKSGMTTEQKAAVWALMTAPGGITDQDGDMDVDLDDVEDALDPGPEFDDDVEDDPYWKNHELLRDEAANLAVDLDGNGKLSADELFKAIDWDGDGQTGNADKDSDGDGEPDSVENRMDRVAGDNRPNSYDANKWPDRDGDGLRDFTDTDGDGVLNVYENMRGPDGNRTGDPLDPNKKPAGDWLTNGHPPLIDQRPGREGERVGTGANLQQDTDGDGAPDWLEDYFARSTWPAGTTGLIDDGAKTDPSKFPDSDGDGIWDFGAGFSSTTNAGDKLNATYTPPTPGTATGPTSIQLTPNTPGSSPGSTPFPNVPPTPGAAPNAGGTAAPSVPTPSNTTNAAQVPSQMPSYTEAPALTNTNQANYVNTANPSVSGANAGSGVSSPGGASPSSPAGIGSGGTNGGGIGGGGGGGGSGGEGDGEGGGSYREVWVPRGTSSNWMGAGGGSWKQGAGADHGAGMGSMLEGFRATLANFAPNGLQAYGTAAHVLKFDLPWPTGGFHHVEIPAIPDTGTPMGQAVEVARTILRLYCAVMCGWVFYCRVLIVLRQW